ncbi:DCC1-like thiol-disulfide oxidoreductase family protein [Jeotgalibacillus marinus]|uniref:DCC1-like thiol-disulfide oxidoreductase family protein n=1 Tax=Jeotgalibacillus marinus TaxID=86667 RepID=A0ABV3Q4Z5_9BACL
MINKLVSLNNKKHMLIGASLIRITLGFIILYNYIIHYHQRSFLWGPNGITGFSETSLENITLFSLYNFSTSSLYFDLIYHLGMIVALSFLVGYKGKVTSILNFIFVWSIMARNSLILDGGDNISRIILFYLLFAKTTAYFSVDSYLKNKRKGSKETTEISVNHFSLRNLVHNLAILACLTQVSIMYLSSGFHKASGEMWQNGTAIYYILQVDEFSHPFFREILHSSDLFLVLATLMTVIIQLAFPFLLFNRYTRYLAMFGVISMHSGIAVVMGLISFSFLMIANQLLFLSDKEYKSLSSYVKQKYISTSTRLNVRKVRNTLPVSARSSLRPIVVLYDGWCPFCMKSIKRFQRLDWFNRMEFLSFRDKKVLEHYQLDIELLEKRMHSLQRSTQKIEDGIDSINRICKNTPLLWVVVPCLSISSTLGVGAKVYDWIASRRTIFPTGGCDESSCEIPVKKRPE